MIAGQLLLILQSPLQNRQGTAKKIPRWSTMTRSPRMGKPGVGLQVISHISVLYNKVRSSCGIFNMCLCCLFKKKICNSGYFPACQKFSTFWPICYRVFFWSLCSIFPPACYSLFYLPWTRVRAHSISISYKFLIWIIFVIFCHF